MELLSVALALYKILYDCFGNIGMSAATSRIGYISSRTSESSNRLSDCFLVGEIPYHRELSGTL
jgi:hypothetical protein